MKSRARHARAPQPQGRTRKAMPRVARAWYRSRAAVRYCSPDTARKVGWRIFWLCEASVVSMYFLRLVPPRFAADLLVAAAAGFMGLLLGVDAHIRRQQRQWQQAGARRLVLADPVMPDDLWLSVRRNTARVDAIMDAMHRVSEQTGVQFPAEDTGWTPVVIEGGRNDPAA